MGALVGMSGTGGALGEIKTKTEKETNNIGDKGEKKRGRKVVWWEIVNIGLLAANLEEFLKLWSVV